MQPNKIDLTKILKVGDKVYSDKRGDGEVIKICDNGSVDAIYIYYSHFDNGEWYNKFGFADAYCIFHELYPSSALEPWPQPCPFEKGELVWVSNDEIHWYYGWFIMMDNDLFCVQVKSGLNLSFRHCRPFSECPLPPKIDVK